MTQYKASRRQAAGRRLAVALEYTGSGAPRVTAKGSGSVADEIIRIAEQHDVPLRPDRELVELLTSVDLDQEIPEALYRAVAEVIAFAYLIKGKAPNGAGGAGETPHEE